MPATANPAPAADLLDQLDDALTPGEIARAAGTHIATPYRWMDRGIGGVRLPYVKVGRKRKVLRADYAAFLRELTRRQAGDPAACETARCEAGDAADAADRELEQAGW